MVEARTQMIKPYDHMQKVQVFCHSVSWQTQGDLSAWPSACHIVRCIWPSSAGDTCVFFLKFPVIWKHDIVLGELFSILLINILESTKSWLTANALEQAIHCTTNKNALNFILDDSSMATVEISDSSSLIGDFDFLENSSSSLDSLSPELELLSQEIISKGPQQSELELRSVVGKV